MVELRTARHSFQVAGGGGIQHPDTETGLTARFFFKMATEGQELAIACAKAAEEMQAEDIRVLDLRGLSSLTDFMIVCSGNSMPHLKAILREVDKRVLESAGAKPSFSEGKADSRWVVLDYIDVMVHVLDFEMRALYALEDLWGDAKDLDWGATPEA